MGKNITERIKGRVEALSSEEWLFEYENDKLVWPALWRTCEKGFVTLPGNTSNTPPDEHAQNSSTIESYRYVGYKTWKNPWGKGGVIIDLENEQTGNIYPAFFNANITYQRGLKKGMNFNTGKNGRFWISPMSKLARFWTRTVGPIEKHSTLYLKMNKLSYFRFVGEIKFGRNYQQIVNLRKIEDY